VVDYVVTTASRGLFFLFRERGDHPIPPHGAGRWCRARDGGHRHRTLRWEKPGTKFGRFPKACFFTLWGWKARIGVRGDPNTVTRGEDQQGSASATSGGRLSTCTQRMGIGEETNIRKMRFSGLRLAFADTFLEEGGVCFLVARPAGWAQREFFRLKVSFHLGSLFSSLPSFTPPRLISTRCCFRQRDSRFDLTAAVVTAAAVGNSAEGWRFRLLWRVWLRVVSCFQGAKYKKRSPARLQGRAIVHTQPKGMVGRRIRRFDSYFLSSMQEAHVLGSRSSKPPFGEPAAFPSLFFHPLIRPSQV